MLLVKINLLVPIMAQEPIHSPHAKLTLILFLLIGLIIKISVLNSVNSSQSKHALLLERFQFYSYG